jgi:malate dehydrogenase (oxaloacetate-decarboxylating)
MAAHTDRPIIFPLSNPTSKCEALPADLIRWTNGKALIATGSPFAPVKDGDREITIGQCNNAFIFPGVGLGVISTKSTRVTNSMFVAAARALSELSPARKNSAASLFPALEDVRQVSFKVAMAVGAEAQRLGLAEKTDSSELERRIRSRMWNPEYLKMKLER